jgi:hypothetical protein
MVAVVVVKGKCRTEMAARPNKVPNSNSNTGHTSQRHDHCERQTIFNPHRAHSSPLLPTQPFCQMEDPSSSGGWRFAQCFGDKGEVDDITEGTASSDPMHHRASLASPVADSCIFLLNHSIYLSMLLIVLFVLCRHSRHHLDRRV